MGVRRSSLLLILLLSACAAPPAALMPPSLMDASAALVPGTEPTPPMPKAIKKPVLQRGKGTFSRTATGSTAIVGTAGTLTKYCVQVEDGITTFNPNGFAADVDTVLADPRSWIAGKRWRWQRVSSCGSATLRIQLSTPDTTDKVCASWGMDTEGKYSCRAGSRIMINLRRWTYGVPHFVTLATYREMVINHETGHFLGFKHVNCPGSGKLAPVMQTQTIALNGCKANPYPYPNGRDYVG